MNDLRNRYTLTKGSTQKMVNTPCVILADIQTSFCLSRLSFCFCFLLRLCGDDQAYSSPIAPTTNLLLASADLRCVTLDQGRNWSWYACLLNSLSYNLTLTFEDVTTRGNYYPDKSMATAAVSHRCAIEAGARLICTEPATIPARHESDQSWFRESCRENRGAHEAGTTKSRR